MNRQTNDSRQAWSRLTSAARTVRDDRDVTAPYGFSTRVAALAFALRALGVSCLLALGSVALNYQELTTGLSGATGVQLEEFESAPVSDAVAVVLDLTD
jgi:hypothetical protein